MSAVTYNRYAQETILKLLKQFMAYAPGVRANKDIEPLHQMRVTSRRLRNALWVFKGLFPPKVLEESRNNLRTLAWVLGQARDLDVKIEFLQELQATVAGPPLKSGLKKFSALLKKKRTELQPRVVQALAQLRKEKTLRNIQRMLTASPQEGKGVKKLYKVAGKKILKRLRRLLEYERFVPKSKRIRGLHQMRIAAKHLRYTLEGFALLFGKKMDRFIQPAREIQGYLGEVHDFDVWRNSLREFTAAGEKDNDFKKALDFFKDRCEFLKDKGYNEFVRAWAKTRRHKIFEQLVKSLGND